MIRLLRCSRGIAAPYVQALCILDPCATLFCWTNGPTTAGMRVYGSLYETTCSHTLPSHCPSDPIADSALAYRITGCEHALQHGRHSAMSAGSQRRGEVATQAVRAAA